MGQPLSCNLTNQVLSLWDRRAEEVYREGGLTTSPLMYEVLQFPALDLRQSRSFNNQLN
jgi:hypothetical protein